MRLKIFFSIVLFSLALNANAQQTQILLGPEIPLRGLDDYQGLLHADETGYTIHIYERSGKGILGQPGRRLILEKYGKDFEQLYSYEYGTDKMITVDLISSGKGYVWVVVEKSGSYKYTYSMIPISLDGKEGAKQRLFAVEIGKEADIPEASLLLSPDSTNVAFVSIFDRDSKKKAAKIYTAMASEQGVLVWDEWTDLKGNQKQYEIQDLKCTNDAEVVVVTKYFRDKDAKETKRTRDDTKVAGYTMELIRLHPDLKKLVKQPIVIDRSYIKEASIRLDPITNDVLCAGFTSTKEDGNINGVFFVRYDNEMKTLHKDQRSFSIEELIYLDKADADVNFKKGKEGLDNEYGMVDMILMPDGRTIITAERNYARTNNNSFNNFNTFGGIDRNSNFITTLYSNDIVVIEVAAGGSIDEVNIIPKKQSAIMESGWFYTNPGLDRLRRSDLFLSHTHMQLGSSILFFYNDREDNFSKEMHKRRNIDRSRRMHTAEVEFSLTEITDIAPILGDVEGGYVLSPTRSRQISDSTFFMTLVRPSGRNVGSFRLGVIKY